MNEYMPSVGLCIAPVPRLFPLIRKTQWRTVETDWNVYKYNFRKAWHACMPACVHGWVNYSTASFLSRFHVLLDDSSCAWQKLKYGHTRFSAASRINFRTLTWQMLRTFNPLLCSEKFNSCSHRHFGWQFSLSSGHGLSLAVVNAKANSKLKFLVESTCSYSLALSLKNFSLTIFSKRQCMSHSQIEAPRVHVVLDSRCSL